MSLIKISEVREPKKQLLAIPVDDTMRSRYYRVANELRTKNLTKLHDLARERIKELLNEVEDWLKSS